MIYCRVSTKEQVEEGNSLATQERNCREYAAKHGYEISATFIEQGESAKTADRTELKKLIAFCTKKHAINAVIVYKLDRLSRNTDDYSHIRILLKQHHVEIKSTSEHFEDSPAGRFMENIIANVAQFDNDVRTERCVGGMRDAIREGRYVWMAPYGYSNVRVNGKATIAPNENAEWVKRAYEEVAKQQFPVTEIRKKLNAHGMATLSGKPLSQSYFYTLLKNKLYTGWINKFGERYKGTFQPIVSEGLFLKVQEVLSGKRNSKTFYRKLNDDFPLRGFFRHSSGRLMTGCWAQGRYKKYPYYLIHKHGINIRKEILESTFKQWLKFFCMDIDYFEKLKATVQEHTINAINAAKRSGDEIQKKIEALKGKQSLIIDKNINGVINDALCKEALQKIDVELYELEQQLRDAPSSSIDYSHLLDITRTVLLNPDEAWEKAGIEEKIKLQWFYFPHGIEIDKNESRTAKICKLFNGKMKNSCYHSSNVHYQNSKLNNTNWQILRLPDKIFSLEENENALSNIQTELVKLSEIITPSQKVVDPPYQENPLSLSA